MANVNDFAAAIARYEGYYTAGSVAQRNNNPGNLRSWGSYPVVNGFVQFPDAETGWAALRSQVQKNIDRGLTLDEFFSGKSGVYPGYAPAADNNQPSKYAATVATWLGISSDAPLAAALAGGGGSDAESSDAGGAVYASVLPSRSLATAALAVAAVSLVWLLFAGRRS